MALAIAVFLLLRTPAAPPPRDLAPEPSAPARPRSRPRLAAEPEGAAPAPAAPVTSTGAAQTAAELARPYAPWDEPPPPLRGVAGLVRDAYTHRPIAGAWITWRLPPPGLVDRVLGDPAFRGPRFRMVSDAEGRFAVDRLPRDVPLSTTLFAVAPGYAYAAVEVGAARELTIDLVPTGALEVVVHGAGRPHVRLRAKGQQAVLRELPGWGDAPGVFRIGHLAPGRYTVQLDPDARGPSAGVDVLAGQVARVELRRRPTRRLAGSLAVAGRARAGAELVAVHAETFARTPLATDRDGRFEVDLQPGRYALFLVDGRSERRLPGLLEPGAAAAALELDAPPAQLRLHLTRAGKPAATSALGLVQLDAPLTSLIAPSPGDAPGEYVAAGEPGRYAVFDGSTYLGQASLPGEAALELTPRTLRLRLGLTGLGPQEVVRGEVALIPAAVQAARPDLAGRLGQLREPFTASAARATLELPLGPPGQYLLVGRSDLGTFRRELTLSGAGPLETYALPLVSAE